MPHWLLKSALQRGISCLPASHKWNELFQQHVTKSLVLTADRFEARLDHCRKHLEFLLRLRPELEGRFTSMELGTGWYPVVPVGMFLCGARKIWTFDIAPLLKQGRLLAMLDRFLDYHSSGRLERSLPRLRLERLEKLRSVREQHATHAPETLLRELDIEVHVRDAQHTGLPDGVADFFTSTGVLEYIPKPVLEEILRECRRVASPDAAHCHYLNLVDQFSYFDRSITPFNFLRYSPRVWNYLNSPVTWQNRMRIADFRELFARAGYRIVEEENTRGNLEDLEQTPLAPEFRAYSIQDLLVLHSWLVAEPLPK